MSFLRLEDLDISGKRVLVRQDLNVPVKNGNVTNDKRIRASLPTIKLALEKGARLIVMSHRGRPSEGQFSEEDSMAPVAAYLGELLGFDVTVDKDWLDGTSLPEPGKMILAENVRFLVGEKKNDEELGKRMAALCDIYVNDAFGTAHRAQASTHAVARFAPVACAGPLLAFELDSLAKGLKDPAKPMYAIVGGSKVSTKITVLENLMDKVDGLIPGGGIANTFLAASGKPVGTSLHEPDQLELCQRLLARAKDSGAEIPLPVDVVVATELSDNAVATLKDADDVAENEMILDVGPKTVGLYAERLGCARTIVWNGPVGVFENPAFAAGTKGLGEAVAASSAFSIVGGGDTVAAIEQFGLEEKISYVSTGGGAFLEFLEGKKLPAQEILEERANG